jgi:hypothetical protein
MFCNYLDNMIDARPVVATLLVMWLQRPGRFITTPLLVPPILAVDGTRPAYLSAPLLRPLRLM